MANTVKMKQSSVAGKVPTTAQLALGELAINTYDGKLYLKKSVSGTESIVDVTAALSGSFDQVISTNNGNGTNFKVGDDTWIGDVNVANTLRITGQQNAANGYIIFGNGDSTALGRSGTGALTYGGNTVLTSATSAGSFPTLNQSTTGNAATATTATNLSGGSISSATSIGIGGAAAAGQNFTVGGTFASSGAASSPIGISGTIPSSTTASYASVDSLPSTQAASFTLTNLIHFRAYAVNLGSGSSVTAQFGFLATSSLTGATYNYGFYGNIASGTGRWNFYAPGTAPNYFAGQTGIGTSSIESNYQFKVAGHQFNYPGYVLSSPTSGTWNTVLTVENNGIYLVSLRSQKSAGEQFTTWIVHFVVGDLWNATQVANYVVGSGCGNAVRMGPNSSLPGQLQVQINTTSVISLNVSILRLA